MSKRCVTSDVLVCCFWPCLASVVAPQVTVEDSSSAPRPAALLFSQSPSTMSGYAKVKGHGQEEARVHRIRITLTSKNVKNLEKGTFVDVM